MKGLSFMVIQFRQRIRPVFVNPQWHVFIPQYSEVNKLRLQRSNNDEGSTSTLNKPNESYVRNGWHYHKQHTEFRAPNLNLTLFIHAELQLYQLEKFKSRVPFDYRCHQNKKF